MTATRKFLLAALGAANLLAFSSASLASDANGERDPSIYDQFPDCMNRGQVQQGQPAPCELPAPAPTRLARAPLGGNVTPAVGNPVAVPGTTSTSTSTAGAASTESSASTTQAASRLRATR